MGPHTRTVTYTETLAAAAVKVAASLGVHASDPVILANGANVIVHLSPAPVVAKVAASTPAVRPDNAAWLQRELERRPVPGRPGRPGDDAEPGGPAGGPPR